MSESAMAAARATMIGALRKTVVPVLRQLGFQGAYPHFHRASDRHVDLLTFQFRRAGGSFVAEISYAEPGRDNVRFDKDAAAGELRVSQTVKRLRLGAPRQGADHWFSFEPVGLFRRPPDFDEIAATVATLIHMQALPWWNAQRRPASTSDAD